MRGLQAFVFAQVFGVVQPGQALVGVLGAGVEHILKVLRVDFYTALQSGQRLGTGLRVGYGF